MNVVRRIFALIAFLLWIGSVSADVRIRAVFDEADAALSIMAAYQAGDDVKAEQWQALWESEAYVRLLAREASMGRDQDFGDKLAAWLSDPANYDRVAEYRRAVDDYRSFDANRAGERAAAYLPAGLALAADFYPVIKHTMNTFVYDLDEDPAIFMTVDPANSAVFVESVLSHELHHVGYAQCPSTADAGNLLPEQRWVVERLGVFGEGLATLATAGGPDRHPHFYSTPAEWAIWERDVANIGADLPRMEAFFSAVLDGKVPEDERRKGLFAFIATPDVPQGAAYTLGWKMASLIERMAGQERLVEIICDPRDIMREYNRLAATTQADGINNLPLWSGTFLDRLYPP